MGGINYIPVKDSDFDIWQKNIVAQVTANQVAWGIPAAIVASINAPKTLWETKYAPTTNPQTCTSAQTQAKNDARKAYESFLRKLVDGALLYNPMVSDEQRREMRLHVHDKKPSPAPVPTSWPLMVLLSGKGNQVNIVFKQEPDESGTSRRAKPEHVARFEVCYKIGDPAPVDATDCPNKESATRSPLILTFKGADLGKKLYVYGRWINTRNQPGPWTALPMAIIIP